MEKYLKLIILVLFNQSLLSQNTFEETFFWSNDFNSYGVQVLEDDSNNIYVLADITDFYSGDGIVINAPYWYNISIFKVDSIGNLKWKKLYETFSSFLSYSNQKMEWNNNRLLMPYQKYFDYQPCSGTIAQGITSYLANLVVSPFDGSTVADNVYIKDSVCGLVQIKSYNIVDNNMTIIYETELGLSEIESIQSNITFNDSTVYNLNELDYESGQNVYFDTTLGKFVGVSQYKINIYDSVGYLIKSIVRNAAPNSHIIEAVYACHAKYKNGIFTVACSGSNSSEGSVSVVFAVDTFGNEISSKQYKDEIVDIEFINDTELLLLADKEFANYSSLNERIENPITVYKTNIFQTDIYFQDYGFDFVQAKDFLLANNGNSIIILGTTDMATFNLGADKDRNRLYLLKTEISGIQDVYTANKEIQKGSIYIYPNPSKEFVFIQSEDFKFNAVSIFDNLGRTIFTDNFELTNKYTINTTVLNKGVYFVRCGGNDREKVEKIIIK